MANWLSGLTPKLRGARRTETLAAGGSGLCDELVELLERFFHRLARLVGGDVSKDKAQGLLGDVPGLSDPGAGFDRFEFVAPDSTDPASAPPVGRLGRPCDPVVLVELGHGIDHRISNATLHRHL